jgi:4-hydroxythreonine-4-phosphate dehydrogenase
VRFAKPIVGISMGDPSGIGPEVTAAVVARPRVRKELIPVIFGDLRSLSKFPGLKRFRFCAPEAVGRADQPTVCVVSQLDPQDRAPGKPTFNGGLAQLAYVKAAIEAARRGEVDGLCTAPVSKEQITRSGVPFMGHTELLAAAFGVEVLMLMDGPRLRVALATNHVPIAQLPNDLSGPRLVSQLHLLSRSLRPLVGRKPRIAVCGLNPHAGEGGLLGLEEVQVIRPAIDQARAEGVDCRGPFAADGLFSQEARGFDAVLAMFHDQGLVAVKALDFDRTVNVTLGLPLPRTSPDHGVAYRLAGKGKASAEPMAQALLKAAELVRRWPRRSTSIGSPSDRAAMARNGELP